MTLTAGLILMLADNLGVDPSQLIEILHRIIEKPAG